MRLWTVHPRYLDAQGLVALWREALLARAVLRRLTRGYRHHPQLERFLAHAFPRRAISVYLAEIYAEARARGYRFDKSKIGPVRSIHPMPVTTGQVSYEWWHLLRKLYVRNRKLHSQLRTVRIPECHSLFRPITGPIEPWERKRRDA
jgi:hypothetical protein